VALQENDLETVRGLVARGANVNLRVPAGLQGPAVPTVLMLAAAAGDEAFTRRVLDRGAVVNPIAVDWMGRDDASSRGPEFAPLLLAAASGDPEVVRMLLAAGADPQAKFLGRLTALMLAEGAGNRQAADLLRKAGAKRTNKPPHVIVLREGMSGTLMVGGCGVTINEKRRVQIATPYSLNSGLIGFRLSPYRVSVPGLTVWGYAGLILIEY